MKYLHTMVRVSDVDKSLDFYCNKLGLKETRRMESEQGRFTLIYLAAPGDEHTEVELTYNWDPEVYGEGRNFGHLAFEVEDIYATCEKLDEGRRHHQPAAAGRLHGLHPLAGQHLDRALAKGRAEAEAGALGVDGEYRKVVAGRPAKRGPMATRVDWYPLGELNPCFQVENLAS